MVARPRGGPLALSALVRVVAWSSFSWSLVIRRLVRSYLISIVLLASDPLQAVASPPHPTHVPSSPPIYRISVCLVFCLCLPVGTAANVCRGPLALPNSSFYRHYPTFASCYTDYMSAHPGPKLQRRDNASMVRDSGIIYNRAEHLESIATSPLMASGRSTSGTPSP